MDSFKISNQTWNDGILYGKVDNGIYPWWRGFLKCALEATINTFAISISMSHD